MKKRWLLILLVIVIFIIIVSSCFGGKKLLPGKYEVNEAIYEVSDQDYELYVKDYGEYDVKNLKVITDPATNKMILEIKQDGSHILYVKSEQDIVIEQEQKSLKFKKKRK